MWEFIWWFLTGISVRSCSGLSKEREKNKRGSPVCGFFFSIIEPPHLCFHVLEYVIPLEAQPEKAHCCRGEKKNKTHQWGRGIQSIFTGNERHLSLNGLCSTCNTHVPKHITAWTQTGATATGHLLLFSSNRIIFYLDESTNIQDCAGLYYNQPPNHLLGHCLIDNILQMDALCVSSCRSEQILESRIENNMRITW